MSRRLLMDDLKAEVEKVLMQSLDKNNFAQICDFAEDYESQALAEHCARFILEKHLEPDWRKMEKLPSVATFLVKHIRPNYVTRGNLMQLCGFAQKFLNDSLAKMCANFVLKKNIKLEWKQVEKIPIVTAVIHQQLMERVPSKVVKKREDFASKELYGEYVMQNVKKGSVVRSRVREIESWEGLKVGDLVTVDSKLWKSGMLKVIFGETGRKVTIFSYRVEILALS